MVGFLFFESGSRVRGFCFFFGGGRGFLVVFVYRYLFRRYLGGDDRVRDDA